MSEGTVYSWEALREIDSRLLFFSVHKHACVPGYDENFCEQARLSKLSPFVQPESIDRILTFRIKPNELRDLEGPVDSLWFCASGSITLKYLREIRSPNGEVSVHSENLPLVAGDLFSANTLSECSALNSTTQDVVLCRLDGRLHVAPQLKPENFISSLDLPVSNHLLTRISYLRATKTFKADPDFIKKIRNGGVFESSLAENIKLFIRKRRPSDGFYLYRRTQASLNPLETRILEAEEPEPQLEENEFGVVFPEGIYVKDLDHLIYDLHRITELMKKRGVSSIEPIDSGLPFEIYSSPSTRHSKLDQIAFEGLSKTCVDLKLLKTTRRSEYFAIEREVEEQIQAGLSQVFLFNIHSTRDLSLGFRPNFLISVCSGLYPLKLFHEFIDKKNFKSLFIDQNFRAVSYWKRLVEASSPEDIAELIAQLSVTDRPDFSIADARSKERFEALVHRWFSELGFNAMRSLNSLRKTEFEWDNFIERPLFLSRRLRPEDRPLIWISNSFKSTPTRFLYDPLDLERRFSLMIHGFCQNLRTSAWQSPHSGRFGPVVFGHLPHQPLGVLLDDSNFKLESFLKDSPQRVFHFQNEVPTEAHV